MNRSCGARTRTLSVMKKCDAAEVTDMNTNAQRERESTCRLGLPEPLTCRHVSRYCTYSPGQTHIYLLHGCDSEGSATFIFHVYPVVSCCCFKDPLIVQRQKSAHITSYQCDTLCMCGRWDTCVVRGGRLAGA